MVLRSRLLNTNGPFESAISHFHKAWTNAFFQLDGRAAPCNNVTHFTNAFQKYVPEG